MQATPRLIDIPELQKRIPVKRTKIYEMIKRGELRVIKLGRRSFFDAAAVDALVAALISPGCVK
jgi:excisionase family DNA binding protein